jgi:hypothetical protein
MCPLEAMTLYPLPKKLVMVRAFAGDSTIIKFFIITYFILIDLSQSGVQERL